MIAADSETTGLFIKHGCRAFAVSTYNDNGDPPKYWDFRVNRMTRTPIYEKRKVRDIEDYLNSDEDGLVFHNAKFDCHALEAMGVRLPHWDKIFDTWHQSHLVNSAEPHNLKGLAARYIGIGDSDQKELLKVSNKSRRLATKLGWAVAHEDHPHFKPANGDAPKEGWPVCDMWIPKELSLYAQEKYENRRILTREETIHFAEVCERYAMLDAERTLWLFYLFRSQIEERKLTKQDRFSHRTIRVAYDMENIGIPIHSDVMEREEKRTQAIANKHFETAKRIAAESLPANTTFNPNSYKQLCSLLYDNWRMPVIKRTKKGQLSTDFKTIADLTFPDGIKVKFDKRMHEFGKSLILGKKHQKTCDYIKLFRANEHNGRLYPSINLVQTGTTRLSYNNPPTQIVSKGFDESKEENDGLRELMNELWKSDLGLRKCFGPEPGFMWYSIDYSQLQLRIFAYISDEKSLQEAFARGWDAHDYMASRIFKLPPGVKPNKMQRRIGKNVNFGFIFGASPRKIEQTAGRDGLWGEVTKMFSSAHAFMKATQARVRKDKVVFTPGGYPLVCDQTHKGVNYMVQGSEGEIVKRAMIDCYNYLNKHSESGIKLIAQVHDELLFSVPLPKWDMNDRLKFHFNEENKATLCFEYSDCPHLWEIKNLMENAGQFYNMVVPTEPEVILKSWDKGIKVLSL